MTTLAITMAGRGSRFRAEGETRPKFAIEVFGRPLFDWAMISLEAFAGEDARFRFATRSEDQAQAFIAERCNELGMAVDDVVELDAVTDGQATTALHLAAGAVGDRPFAVFNIDTFVRPGAMRPSAIPAGAAGWIPCFPGPGEGWSFARVDEREPDGDRVVALREKQRISPHASVGFYWFASAQLFIDTYHCFFAEEANCEQGERYIAPMYNALIARGARVHLDRLALEDVGMLGTPDQVRAFKVDPPAAAVTLCERKWAHRDA